MRRICPPCPSPSRSPRPRQHPLSLRRSIGRRVPPSLYRLVFWLEARGSREEEKNEQLLPAPTDDRWKIGARTLTFDGRSGASVDWVISLGLHSAFCMATAHTHICSHLSHLSHSHIQVHTGTHTCTHIAICAYYTLLSTYS